MNEIARCPNPECESVKPPRAEKTPTLVQNMWWRVRCSSCDYRGSCAATEEEAIRLHNLISAAPDDGKGQPIFANQSINTERMLAIADELESEGHYTMATSVRRITRQRDAMAAPQGWQQGAAREICEYLESECGHDTDEIDQAKIEAILTRHQEGNGGGGR